MVGLLIGCLCGLVELVLLIRMTVGLGDKGSSYKAAIFLIKALAFGISAAVVVIIAKEQLLWFGVGVSGVLIGGSIVTFCKQAFSGGKTDA